MEPPPITKASNLRGFYWNKIKGWWYLWMKIIISWTIIFQRSPKPSIPFYQMDKKQRILDTLAASQTPPISKGTVMLMVFVRCSEYGGYWCLFAVHANIPQRVTSQWTNKQTNQPVKDNAKTFALEKQHGHCQHGFALWNLLWRTGKEREERGIIPPHQAACQAR